MLRMIKKLLGIIILGLLLSGCADPYISYQEKYNKLGRDYKYVWVKSPSTGKNLFYADNTYANALNAAKRNCRNQGIDDCIIYKRGNTYVYDPPKPPSEEDKMIAKARNICEKIGATPGTDKFIDCTIKMMSTSTGQQTIFVGQQRRSIYPLHCRQMGGMSNC